MVAMWDKWQGITRNWTFGRLLGFLGMSQIYGVFFQQSWHTQPQPQNRLGYEAPNIGGDMDWLGGCCSVASHWFGIRFATWFSPRDLDQVYCLSSLSVPVCVWTLYKPLNMWLFGLVCSTWVILGAVIKQTLQHDPTCVYALRMFSSERQGSSTAWITASAQPRPPGWRGIGDQHLWHVSYLDFHRWLSCLTVSRKLQQSKHVRTVAQLTKTCGPKRPRPSDPCALQKSKNPDSETKKCDSETKPTRFRIRCRNPCEHHQICCPWTRHCM